MLGGPAQPSKIANTVIVAEIVLVPVFIAVKVGRLSLPFTSKPIEELEFVQVNVAPEILLVKFRAEIVDPAQTLIFEIGLTNGALFTITVAGFELVVPQALLT